ncbi:MAG: glycosyltransferase family 4 protein [Gemmatimonadota bacterium]|nr:glycosyltransferase family 4 protein [Gemmatimonadota bacterium]
MLIGVDATTWANERGYGRFTRELVAAMVAASPDDRFMCLLDPRSAEVFKLTAPNLSAVVVPLNEAPSEAASASGNRGITDMLTMSRAVVRQRLDVFFSPSVYTFFPLPPGLPAVITIHDAIAERFPHLTLPSAKARLFWNLKVRVALKQARMILTVSDHAARDIARIHRVDPSRIRVAVEAPAEVYRPSATTAEIADAARRCGLSPANRWFTYVGGFNPHKNVTHIISAHALLAQELGATAPHLLLVGTLDRDVFHGDQLAIRDRIAECGTEALVHWTGFIDDRELRHLHSGAVALLLPSECEGFGLPAVEAAACGTPVIATTESPLPELLAGGGIFIDPGDVTGLLNAMRAMATDEGLRRRYGEAAMVAARKLSWRSCADAALGAIHEAARR